MSRLTEGTERRRRRVFPFTQNNKWLLVGFVFICKRLIRFYLYVLLILGTNTPVLFPTVTFQNVFVKMADWVNRMSG